VNDLSNIGASRLHKKITRQNVRIFSFSITSRLKSTFEEKYLKPKLKLMKLSTPFLKETELGRVPLQHQCPSFYLHNEEANQKAISATEKLHLSTFFRPE